MGTDAPEQLLRSLRNCGAVHHRRIDAKMINVHLTIMGYFQGTVPDSGSVRFMAGFGPD